MKVSAQAQSASSVDPTSIESRASFDVGAGLIVRRRPPGGVDLAYGQKEHMLMCSVGKPVDNNTVRSVLRTANGRREWRSCPQGHITFVPAGFPIEWDWTYKSDSIHVTMLPSFLASVGEEFEKQDGECPKLRPHFRIMDDGLRSLLYHLREEANSESLGKDLVTSSLLRLIAARVYRLNGSSIRDLDAGQDACRFSAADSRKSIEILNDRLDEKISLAEFAAEFGLSPFHFARVFKRATGFPPHEYQLQLRVARAQELLRSDLGKTIAEIACELGFSDESHFRRHFRRIVGTTPGQFRQQQ
ncbi:MAG: AraC family transcriptional regulator [Gammaproteobacteria bacterium]